MSSLAWLAMDAGAWAQELRRALPEELTKLREVRGLSKNELSTRTADWSITLDSEGLLGTPSSTHNRHIVSNLTDLRENRCVSLSTSDGHSESWSRVSLTKKVEFFMSKKLL